MAQGSPKAKWGPTLLSVPTSVVSRIRFPFRMRSSDSARDASTEKVWHRVCSGCPAIRHIPQLSSKFHVRRSLSRVHDMGLRRPSVSIRTLQFQFQPDDQNVSQIFDMIADLIIRISPFLLSFR